METTNKNIKVRRSGREPKLLLNYGKSKYPFALTKSQCSLIIYFKEQIEWFNSHYDRLTGSVSSEKNPGAIIYSEYDLHKLYLKTDYAQLTVSGKIAAQLILDSLEEINSFTITKIDPKYKIAYWQK